MFFLIDSVRLHALGKCTFVILFLWKFIISRCRYSQCLDSRTTFFVWSYMVFRNPFPLNNLPPFSVHNWTLPFHWLTRLLNLMKWSSIQNICRLLSLKRCNKLNKPRTMLGTKINPKKQMYWIISILSHLHGNVKMEAFIQSSHICKNLRRLSQKYSFAWSKDAAQSMRHDSL